MILLDGVRCSCPICLCNILSPFAAYPNESYQLSTFGQAKSCDTPFPAAHDNQRNGKLYLLFKTCGGLIALPD